jgi:hypothetical protein
MIILHGSAYEGLLLVWGETPRLAEISPPAPGVQRRRAGPSTASPLIPLAAYDARFEPLATAVGLDLRADDDCMPPAIAWLPTLGDNVLASSPLVT